MDSQHNAIGQSGLELGGRYRLLDVIEIKPHSTLWTADDLTLSRSVDVLVITGEGAPNTVDAARRLALLTDPRINKVLDIGRARANDIDLAFVVYEHTLGRSLAEILQDGPLHPSVARTVTGEIAHALHRAHAMGLHHLQLTPGHVIQAPTGDLRLLGTAVEAAATGMDSVPSAVAARLDVVGLVGLLYAQLTGQLWRPGTVAQPPREINPKVPRDLDTLCVATLNDTQDGPTSPGDLVKELLPWNRLPVIVTAAPPLSSTPRRDEIIELPGAVGTGPVPVIDLTQIRKAPVPDEYLHGAHADDMTVPAGGVVDYDIDAQARKRKAGGTAGKGGKDAGPQENSDSTSATTPAESGRGSAAAGLAGAAGAGAASTGGSGGGSGPGQPPSDPSDASDPERSNAEPSEQDNVAASAADAQPTAGDGQPSDVADEVAAEVTADTSEETPGDLAKPATSTVEPSATQQQSATDQVGNGPAGDAQVEATQGDDDVVAPPKLPTAGITELPTLTGVSQAEPELGRVVPDPDDTTNVEPDPTAPFTLEHIAPITAPQFVGKRFDPTVVADKSAVVQPATDFDQLMGGVSEVTAEPSARPDAHTTSLIIGITAVLGVLLVLALIWLKATDNKPTNVVNSPPPAAPVVTTPIDTASGPSPSATTASSTTSATSAAPSGSLSRDIAIKSAKSFDPADPSGENDETVNNIFDANPASKWSTDTYRNSTFGGLKEGLGVVLQYESGLTVSEVSIHELGTGGKLQVKEVVNNDLADAKTLGEFTANGSPQVVKLSTPSSSGTLLIWYSELPRNVNKYQGAIANVSLR